jgi:hypothetical protein
MHCKDARVILYYHELQSLLLGHCSFASVRTLYVLVSGPYQLFCASSCAALMWAQVVAHPTETIAGWASSFSNDGSFIQHRWQMWQHPIDPAIHLPY